MFLLGLENLENSGNFVSPEKWEPSRFYVLSCVEFIELENELFSLCTY